MQDSDDEPFTAISLPVYMPGHLYRWHYPADSMQDSDDEPFTVISLPVYTPESPKGVTWVHLQSVLAISLATDCQAKDYPVNGPL
ncbi:jg5654 [Pararge aegeria aegeria]|uniref:Jg5654 protein n=1 Tax=Pararge aegeria aegeria TaxID=348720 RepID=A0A8S4QT39_9NEOP|nr:jg5654 [Pararge aegeria aegeria]